MKRLVRLFLKIFDPESYVIFLRFRKIRFWVVKLRYRFLKGRLQVKNDGSTHIGAKTISHNLGAFDHDAAFGCGGRMGLLIHPVVGYYSFTDIDLSSKKVLIVGCRSEDDIFWMKSYGFKNTLGFDLFSYSKHVVVGDIHQTSFPSGTFDVVLLGWMLSYTKSPEIVIRECRRILKDGGLLGIGIEHDTAQDYSMIGKGASPRENPANSTAELISLLDSTIRHKVIFRYDHENDHDGDFSTVVISECLPKV